MFQDRTYLLARPHQRSIAAPSSVILLGSCLNMGQDGVTTFLNRIEPSSFRGTLYR